MTSAGVGAGEAAERAQPPVIPLGTGPDAIDRVPAAGPARTTTRIRPHLVVSTVFLLAALLLNGAILWLTSFEALAAAVTLVMVFALQHTQMRQQAAVQRKLDEILRVLPGADQRLLHLETAPQAELDALDERHGTVRDEALVDPATAK